MKDNENDSNPLISNQYNIFLKNIVNSPLVKVRTNSNLNYLKLFSSAIAVINKQAKKIQFIREAKNESKFKWRIEGPFDTSYSLAILNRNYALAMHNLEQNVSLHVFIFIN